MLLQLKLETILSAVLLAFFFFFFNLKKLLTGPHRLQIFLISLGKYDIT